MAECWMYGRDAAFEVNHTCHCCQRPVPRVRSSMWHGEYRICPECFTQWYDPDTDIDVTNPIAIGNYVRSKHGLPPLSEQKP